MRLPVVVNVSTKEGTSNKNARLTNMLKDPRKLGDIAQIRPGLVESETYSGLGNGLIAFDGRVLAMVDDTMYVNTYTSADLDAPEWSAAIEFCSGDFTWYNGALWVGTQCGTNQTPADGSDYWVRTISQLAWPWDAGAAYGIGDAAIGDDGNIYYSMSPSNTGNSPTGSSPLWSLSPPGSSRYRGVYNSVSNGPETADRDSAAYTAWQTYETNYSCATKSGSMTWREFEGVLYVPAHPSGYPYRIRVHQYEDSSLAHDCSSSTDFGVIDGGRVVQTV